MKNKKMKVFGIVVVVFIAAFSIAGVLAPKDFHIEREVLISKPKDTVFNNLKFLKNHNAWNPWAKRDPNITYTFTGNDGEIGFISAWKGNNDVGEGEQEITGIVEGERLDTALRFKKPMEGNDTAYFITESVNETQTKVRWGMDGKNKFPFNVFCLVFNFKAMLSRDFDDGLTSLKTLLEQQ